MQSLIKSALTKLQNHHEVFLLLSHVLRYPYEKIIVNPPSRLSAHQQKLFFALIKKRAADWPLAYLLGKQPFYHSEFFVNKNVLIPRPETEELVNRVINFVGKKKFLIADIGTGCGCIAVSLARELPQVKIAAVDKFAKTIALAKKNATKYKLLPRIKFLKGNLLAPIKKAGLKPDIIVANLPYLPANEVTKPTPNGTSVSPEEWQIIKHEPKHSLIGGQRGDELIRACLKQAALLSPLPQTVFLETAPPQLIDLKLFAQKLFPAHKISIIKDLALQKRFLSIIKSKI